MTYRFPTLRVGQFTETTRTFVLFDEHAPSYDERAINLTDASQVRLTLEHDKFGWSPVEDAVCEITDPEAGEVAYTFSPIETVVPGRYNVQFEVEWSTGETELIPPAASEWLLDVGRRLSYGQSPLRVGSLDADTAAIESLQAGTATIDHLDARSGSATFNGATIGKLSTSSISGGLTANTEWTGIGGGLQFDPEGLLYVAIDEYGTIEGMSNPATADFNLNNYSILGPGRVGTSASRLTDVQSQSFQTTSDITNVGTDSTSLNTVYLEPKTYTVSSGISIDSDTKIDGQGATIQIADLADFHGGVFTIGAVSDVVIEDVTIDLNRAGASTTTSHVYNLGIFSGGASTAENITLRDVTIKNGVNRGIALYHCDNVTFDNVTVEVCDEGCVEIDHGCRSVTITDSEFRNPIGFGIRADATADGVNAVTVTDSHFEDISGTGVDIVGKAQQACKVNDNTFVNVGTAIKPGEDSTANNNTIHRCGDGIQSSGGGTYIGNTLSSITGAGRAIRELAGDSLIAGNTVLGGSGRIEVDGSNAIVNNVCKHVNHWGIQARGDDNTIADNKIFSDSSSTTLAADAAAGATTVQLTANPFILGSHVDIGGESKYIVEHVESATNGTANVVELESALAGAHAAGTAVAATNSRSTGIHLFGSENRTFNNEYPTLLDSGTRNIINGRSATSSRPTQGGSWQGQQALAEEYDVTVISDADKQYKAVNGKWQRINSWFEIDNVAPATPLDYSVAGLGNYDEIKIELNWYLDRATVDVGNFHMRFNDNATSIYAGRMLSTTGFDAATATEFTIAEGEGYRSFSAEITISNQPRASVHADVSHSTNRVLNDGWVNEYAIQADSVRIWESGVTAPGGGLINPNITVKGRNR